MKLLTGFLFVVMVTANAEAIDATMVLLNGEGEAQCHFTGRLGVSPLLMQEQIDKDAEIELIKSLPACDEQDINMAINIDGVGLGAMFPIARVTSGIVYVAKILGVSALWGGSTGCIVGFFSSPADAGFSRHTSGGMLGTLVGAAVSVPLPYQWMIIAPAMSGGYAGDFSFRFCGKL